MSDAASTQPDTQPTRSGTLLALIRRMIDYGRDLVATVRQRAAADPYFAKARFGTADFTVIFASLARALLLARALEARVLRNAAALDKAPTPRPARPAPEPRLPASPQAEPTEPQQPHLAGLPTPEQIAAEVRRRPIGAVIAEIYYRLGIMPSDPLWRDAQQAMLRFGCNLARLLRDILARAFPVDPQNLPPAVRSAWRGRGGPRVVPSGTGPP
jgi:hypothetical protein